MEEDDSSLIMVTLRHIGLSHVHLIVKLFFLRHDHTIDEWVRLDC